MTEVVFALCALMSLLCAVMLLRGYRQERSHLLLWSSLCFVFLAGNNILLFVDPVIIPQIDFGGGFWRNLISTSAGLLLVFGLIWELA